MTKFFKGKNKAIKAPEPRDTKTITDEYGKTAMNAGTVQYQIKVYESQLEQINQQLLALNREAAQRNELDAKTKETTNG